AAWARSARSCCRPIPAEQRPQVAGRVREVVKEAPARMEAIVDLGCVRHREREVGVASVELPRVHGPQRTLVLHGHVERELTKDVRNRRPAPRARQTEVASPLSTMTNPTAPPPAWRKAAAA